MGRLYVAERTGIEGFTKVVALKRILPHLAQDPQLREMFITEARVAARLDHPDIVTTFELGEVDGNYFMSMEYLPGEDLAKILSKCTVTQPMPMEIAATLAQRVADGLHYAHELPDDNGQPAMLVHRDVNPCNIVVTYYGAVKLLDFGVAKETAASSTTFSGVFRGNYAYCAPEQLEGAPLDRRTDIFCLGIVLWECVTGQRLFGGGTDVSNIDAVRSKRIESPSALRPETPPELDAIVMRCLSRDPARRYQRASDLSAALRQYLSTCDYAPDERGIGSWLEQKFGTERCSRKKAIGQGTEIEAALAYLQLGTGATTAAAPGEQESQPAAHHTRSRVLWSTTIRRTPGPSRPITETPPVVPLGGAGPRATPPRTAVTSIMPGVPRADGRLTPPPMTAVTPPPTASTPLAPNTLAGGPGDATIDDEYQEISTHGVAQAGPAARAPGTPARGRALIFGVATLAIGAMAIGGAAALSRTGGTASAPVAPRPMLSAVEVRSEPAGAQVLIDGSPTGLVTPAVLSGLPPGRAVRVELSKLGFRPATLVITPEGTKAPVQNVRLVQTSASVRLVDLPARATVFLDGAQIDTDGLVETSVGRHQLRIESRTKVLFEKDLDLHAGEQVTSVAVPKGEP